MDNKIWIDNSSEVQPMFRSSESYTYNTSDKDGKSILFAGCSITANVGLRNPPHGGWSHYLTEMIKENEPVSDTNNCAISGASTFEIISNVFRFLNKYDAPDFIFLLLPPIHRENNSYAKNLDSAIVLDYNIFNALDIYCRKNNIKLFASTWDFYIPGVTSWFVDDTNKGFTEETFRSFESFFTADKFAFAQDVFEASLYGYLSLEGEERHPAEPVHTGYARMFYEEYGKRK